MSTPILATRLFVPPLRPEVVHRPQLTGRLDAGLHRKLTLISAPAGFGKSTLASEWVAACQRPAAWLSLDAGDNDPSRFMTYFVAALQTIDASLGKGVAGAAAAPQPPLNEALLTTLLNDLATAPTDFLFVLDDYHLIESPAIDEALGFLIEHQPPQMHLVIATREDPNLPLARLRARSQLTELRAADLRFTADEAATFLGQMTGLALTPQEVSALETRTEGWIAGLQLAALSMRGREDIGGFIQAFAGDNRYIVDYLLEEVLHRQPEALRSFLLQTSILSRLSGPLCDAVTGQKDAQSLLETLDRGNLFLVPLDERRHWFRYHHLFGDVLRAHAPDEQPDRMVDLHRRASAWYEKNALPAEAIRHALAAVDYERAATLIELQWPTMDATFRSATWLAWAKALPDDLVRARPVLCLGYAWAFLDGGEMDAGEARLQDAQRWLDRDADTSASPPLPADDMVVADPEQFQNLAASIATARSYIAEARGDASGAALYAERALDLTPREDHVRRGVAWSLLGLARWLGGDLDAAHQSLAEGMDCFRTAGNLNFAISGTYGLAEIRLLQGRLRDAMATYEQALHLVTQQGEPMLLGTAEVYLGLGELSFEQGHREISAQHLQRGEALGEDVALPDFPYRKRLTRARIKISQGDLEGALALYVEAERLYYPNPMPNFWPVAALKARVWIAQGRLSEARGWAQEQRLTPDDELQLPREFEHLTLAKLLLAEAGNAAASGGLAVAQGLLERLRQAAEDGGRTRRVIDALILQALAYQQQGDLSTALVALERGLALAEPEGYVQIFADEGAPMAQLLSEAAAQGIMPEYTGRLREATNPEAHPAEETSLPVRGVAEPASPQPLMEPLSKRELQVLGLIAEGLSNQQIGQRLFLALSTVKGHNLKIFGKLDVKRRTEAVARARELGLL